MILDRSNAFRCASDPSSVGPMSLNCIDASIEIANDYSIPLFLIASRRQIDSADFGGGYVNNWTTRQFSDYVLSKDKKGMVLMARDHGGPWQNPIEVDNAFGLRKAMSSAKQSFTKILNGCQVCISILLSIRMMTLILTKPCIGV